MLKLSKEQLLELGFEEYYEDRYYIYDLYYDFNKGFSYGCRDCLRDINIETIEELKTILKCFKC